MDLRHLRYFLSVAEEMHFGRAAQRLGMSQPPLSQQIRALEQELGVVLFERTSRRVRLTEAGTRFVPEARATLDQADRAAQIARLAHRGELGLLQLGFSTSVPFVRPVMDALSRYRSRFPEVELKLDELPRDAQIERLERGMLDIGIARTFDTPDIGPNLIARCIRRDGIVLAMRHDHPLAALDRNPVLADLEGEPLVMFGAINGAGFNEHVIAQCERIGFRPDIALEASSFATLLGLTAAGFGLSILSAPMERLGLDTLAFRRMDVPFTSQLLLIHRQNPSPTTRAFADMIGAVCD
ncbi:LysR substrate-binding domain-containing protein [Novosphingobium sp. Leaf2]|uniref:LysR substrate-binding domain-containing protein n=1 Tax=Novosphingobium sp. Leaf2 TaxID=1735670 RepID=UPI0006FB013A|nr:LysR substrate-binding domain-containing protein [Novosphingobium sp. Leaf2]KQM21361.1 LysR family transcriptional regulator [Novosphingobium sp. Leaf2]